MSENPPLMEVRQLKKYFGESNNIFRRNKDVVKAVDGVSFSIHKGETFGLVGESGSGKSTIGRSILRLMTITAGEVLYKGRNLHHLSKNDLRYIRPHRPLSSLDPFSSLFPGIRIGDAIGEAMIDHGLSSKNEVYDKVLEVLCICGPAPHHYCRLLHVFRGGQGQRM